ncbi:hypothetical protein BI364_13170 [Acidihalobacter yilgarnensis]|uniref:PepSY domain-containing protein n=1 Tax=Acidihalobacter yilgarnensis TaxID=2819280 RepID=A0A1D8IQK1_9GAMM|nr:PepSY domain-containing protein [Acidihalobacter yilgarnensis]AOU98788.1 hypothetical protein BI364_13170 [Acidihalobacter yilgarnensis]
MRRLLCSVLIAFSGGAYAGPPVAAFAPPTPAGIGLLAERFISPADAAAAARAAVGGRVLAVHRMGEGPGARYRVRLLVGGQIRIVLVDAHDGRVLR